MDNTKYLNRGSETFPLSELQYDYFTVSDASGMTGVPKDTICRHCRQKLLYGARKIRGLWWIPISGLFPFLRKPEYAEAVAEIGGLRLQYMLRDIGYACDLLRQIDGYNKQTMQYMKKGKSEAESKVLANQICATSLQNIERLSYEYSRNGLQGIIEYTQACQFVIGWPAIESAADLVYIAKDINKNEGDDMAEQPLSIRWYLDLISGWRDKLVNNARKTLEGSTEGQRIVKANPNRRLYAVLKPTKKENLERIEYMLTGIGPFGLFELLASVKLSKDIYEQENRDTG